MLSTLRPFTRMGDVGRLLAHGAAMEGQAPTHAGPPAPPHVSTPPARHGPAIDSMPPPSMPPPSMARPQVPAAPIAAPAGSATTSWTARAGRAATLALGAVAGAGAGFYAGGHVGSLSFLIEAACVPGFGVGLAALGAAAGGALRARLGPDAAKNGAVYGGLIGAALTVGQLLASGGTASPALAVFWGVAGVCSGVAVAAMVGSRDSGTCEHP